MAVAVQAYKWHHEVAPGLAAEYDTFFADNVHNNLYDGDEDTWQKIKNLPNCYAFTDYPYK